MSEDAPHYGPMTEQRAREILRYGVMPAGGLGDNGEAYIDWKPGDHNEYPKTRIESSA